jgi:hypothetical protein
MTTIVAFEDLEPIITRLGAHDEKALRRDLACLLAYHSCRPGTFAQAYAHADLMACFGVTDPWAMSVSFILKHPITAFQMARGRQRQRVEQERAAKEDA